MKYFLLLSSIVFLWISCSGATPMPAETSVQSQPSTDTASGADSPDAAAWRKQQPQVGTAPEVVTPFFEQAQLSNGLTVMVVKRTTLPLVSVSLVLKSGSAAESSAATQGLADFTYEMMMEGAGNKDGVALAEAFADLGTQMHVRTSEDAGAFKALLLKKNLDAGMDLMAEILTKPSFKKKDLVRKKKERLSDLDSLMGNPNYLSSIATAARVYGNSHPYAHPVMGTLKTVEGFSLKQLKGFYRTHVVPQNAALILTGDITLEEAVALSTKKLGSWKGKFKSNQRVADATDKPPLPPYSIAMVAKPGMNQTIISAGIRTLPVGHKDEWALRIAIDAFAGMFGSRLNMNLREDKGYTYGARGHLEANFLEGAAMLSTSVQGDVTGAALVEVLAELDKLKSKPLTEAEFHGATENVLKSVSGWFESVSALGVAAQSIFERRLPLTRYGDMLTAYERLTLPEVRHAADTYLNKSNIQIVLVGDPTIIEQQLSSRSLGELELLE